MCLCVCRLACLLGDMLINSLKQRVRSVRGVNSLSLVQYIQEQEGGDQISLLLLLRYKFYKNNQGTDNYTC